MRKSLVQSRLLAHSPLPSLGPYVNHSPFAGPRPAPELAVSTSELPSTATRVASPTAVECPPDFASSRLQQVQLPPQQSEPTFHT